MMKIFRKIKNLKSQMLLSFFAVIVTLSLSFAVLGYYVIRTDIMGKTQDQVKNDLKAARSVFNNEAERLKQAFGMINFTKDIGELQNTLDLDYLYVVEVEDTSFAKNPILSEAARGNLNGGTRIMGKSEISRMNYSIKKRAHIEIRSTPHSKQNYGDTLETAMVIECAAPVFSPGGEVVRIIYGGKVVNRYFELVDKIRDIVYESRFYKGRPVGTVTIFQDGVRIATNVLDKSGERAVGTRVSDEVYDIVIEKNKSWFDRAFVVTDWYLTAYEPIYDFNGKIIGILYVGILEEPFRDKARGLQLAFFVILGISVFLAASLALFLASAVVKPIREMTEVSVRISRGELEHRLKERTYSRELASLATSFNDMSAKLQEREVLIKESNEKLKALNKSYLDLIGMVSHELKGILSSTMLNTYSVMEGYLGMINFKQKKALKSIAKNLDLLNTTVRNFLNLSRIEKDEMNLNISDFLLKEDIADTAEEIFSRQAFEKNMTIINKVPTGIQVKGDSSLIQIVLNNFVGNAVKYGKASAPITVSAEEMDDSVTVDVFNEGRPLEKDQVDRLFKKFSRLDSPEGRKVRGTGLGLFISRQIVEQHGGSVKCTPSDDGNTFSFTIKKETFTNTTHSRREDGPSEHS
ncbi:MAG: cache domain-containing protein [Fibrobacterota bacterium]